MQSSESTSQPATTTSSGSDTPPEDASSFASSTSAPQPGRIGFSLSENSFALFPPLEAHKAQYPPHIEPTIKQTPAMTDVSDQTDEAYPASYYQPPGGTMRVRCGSYDNLSSAACESLTAEERMSRMMMAAALSYPPAPHKHGPIVIVSSYTCFDDLAHGPRGTEASRAMRTYRLNTNDGSLTLLSAVPEHMMHNPAFTRRHPALNVVYACTESVKHDGQVVALELNGKNGALTEHCKPVSAGGTSTCYLTIHKSARRMLLVNYWDSTICTLELMPDGTLGKLIASYDPKEGRKMKASADKHVNHSLNDEKAQAERQGDPHSHAIVLEPTTGTIAFVPDLGMDLIRQFHFDEVSGIVTPCGSIPSGIKAGKRGLGPRYLAFHPFTPTCYCVNELSSQVAVFAYHADVAASIANAYSSAVASDDVDAAVKAVKDTARPTLSLVQTVSTVPEAFPGEMNTCGRVTIHPTGDFVITSNRGHDSVAVHRVHRDSSPPGMLTLAGIFHTRGETPRHFQFDKSGQWLLVANQDSNTCAVFSFNTSTGKVEYTGNTYSCPSPNFVCIWDGA